MSSGNVATKAPADPARVEPIESSEPGAEALRSLFEALEEVPDLVASAITLFFYKSPPPAGNVAGSPLFIFTDYEPVPNARYSCPPPLGLVRIRKIRQGRFFGSAKTIADWEMQTIMLLAGTQVKARGLQWEVVYGHPAGEQTLYRLRCSDGD